MTAALVLVALVCAATVAARGAAAGSLHVGLMAGPALVVAGVLVSPGSLGFILPSVLEGLVPALRVGAAWLMLMRGLALPRPRSGRDLARITRALVGHGVVWLLTSLGAGAGLALALVFEWRPATAAITVDRATLWSAAAVGAACAAGLLRNGLSSLRNLAPARRGPALMWYRTGGLFVLLALSVLAPWAPSAGEADALPLWWAPLMGVALALAGWAAGLGSRTRGSPARWILAALVVCGAGLCASTGVMEVQMAVAAGVTLSVMGSARGLRTSALFESSTSLGMVLLLLCGAMAGFDGQAFTTGALAAAGRALGRLMVMRTLSWRPGAAEDGAGLMASNWTSLAVALSIQASAGAAGAMSVVGATLWCMVVTDGVLWAVCQVPVARRGIAQVRELGVGVRQLARRGGAP